ADDGAEGIAGRQGHRRPVRPREEAGRHGEAGEAAWPGLRRRPRQLPALGTPLVRDAPFDVDTDGERAPGEAPRGEQVPYVGEQRERLVRAHRGQVDDRLDVASKL